MRVEAAERDLVVRFLRDGDRRAFEELARIHLPSIRRFLAARLRDRAEAEEAEQDLLVRMYEGLSAWKGESSLRTWLFSLCRIAAADLVRRRSRDRARSRRLVLAKTEAEPRPSDRADWALERGAEAESIRRCLAGLGEPLASLIFLRDAEGLGVDELSVIFGMPEGTVKSRLSRGRARLKTLLEREGFGGRT